MPSPSRRRATRSSRAAALAAFAHRVTLAAGGGDDALLLARLLPEFRVPVCVRVVVVRCRSARCRRPAAPVMTAADCAAAGAGGARDTSWSLERASLSASIAPLAASTAPLAASFVRRGRESDQVARRNQGGQQLGAGSSQFRVGRRRCFEALHHVIGANMFGELAEVARVESHSDEKVATLGACPQYRSPAQTERNNMFCRLSQDFTRQRRSYSIWARYTFRPEPQPERVKPRRPVGPSRR